MAFSGSAVDFFLDPLLLPDQLCRLLDNVRPKPETQVLPLLRIGGLSPSKPSTAFNSETSA